MRPNPRLFAPVLLLLAGCVIPSRDNAHDPANIPSAPAPAIAVFVDGLDTTLGQRHSEFTLDASASTTAGGETPPGTSCYEWGMLDEAADDPTLLPDAAWASLLPASCEGVSLLVGTASTPLANALAGITDFENGTGVPDGTGVTTRWVRLRLTTPSGGSANAYRLLAIFNAAPVVVLGDDRRTAPGGEWKAFALTPTAFQNVVRASIQDPDPFVVEWHVTGELATRVDVSPEDGLVDDAFLSEEDAVATFPMSIDPSRSEITVKARDFEDPGIPAANIAVGQDTMRLDVLSTVWAYNEGTGLLSYLDASQFSSDPSVTNAVVLAADGGTVVFARPGTGNVQLATTGRGFGRATDRFLVPAVAANPQTVAVVPDGTGEWWVLEGGNGQFGGAANDGSLRRLDATLENVVFGPVSLLGGTGLRSGFDGKNRAMVRGAGRNVWITGGSDSATIGQRVMLVEPGGTLVFPAVDPFGNDTVTNAVRLLAADGAGGVWAAEESGPRLTHVTAAGAKAEYVVPTSCGNTASIVSLEVDAARSALWLGVVAGSSFRLCRGNAQDLSQSFLAQAVDSVGDLAIDPVTGDALMVGNDGKGISRYDVGPNALGQPAVRSLDYAPMALNVFAQDVSFVDGSLLVNVVAGGNKRALIVEGAEIHTPNNIVLDVDPYLFEEVRHVADPVTGFVWVFLPDEAQLALFTPAGRKIRTVSVPSAREKRGHIAFDAGGRRVWFISSDLYVGENNPTPDGRVSWSDLDEYFDVPVEEDGIDSVVASTAAGIQITMARGVGVVTGSPGAPGRLCLAANFGGETLASNGTVRMVLANGTLASETATFTGATQGAQVWANGNSYRDECWFGLDGPNGVSVTRLRPGLAEFIVNHQTTRDMRRPTFVLPDIAWGASSDATGFVLTRVTSLTSADATQAIVLTASVAAGSIGSSTVDPYWQHVWLGIGVTDQPEGGEIVRLSLQGAVFAEPAVEAARATGFQTPRLANGR